MTQNTEQVTSDSINKCLHFSYKKKPDISYGTKWHQVSDTPVAFPRLFQGGAPLSSIRASKKGQR